jgi:hypothetical protein
MSAKENFVASKKKKKDQLPFFNSNLKNVERAQDDLKSEMKKNKSYSYEKLGISEEGIKNKKSSFIKRALKNIEGEESKKQRNISKEELEIIENESIDQDINNSFKKCQFKKQSRWGCIQSSCIDLNNNKPSMDTARALVKECRSIISTKSHEEVNIFFNEVFQFCYAIGNESF